MSGLGTSLNAIIGWEGAGKPIDDLNSTTIGSEFRCKLVPGSNIKNGPIKIMFSPTGAVESVSYGFFFHKPISPIYLLVGKEKQVRPAVGEILMDYEKEKANLRDMKNKWLVINQQSGAIRSSLLDHVNGPNPSQRVAGPTNTSLPRSTYNSRQLSRESSTGGGE